MSLSLSLSLYIYIYIYISISIYIYIYIYICISLSIYLYLSLYIYIYIGSPDGVVASFFRVWCLHIMLYLISVHTCIGVITWSTYYIMSYLLFVFVCADSFCTEVPHIPHISHDLFRGCAFCHAIHHRLPDGVRTNAFFAEVPQYTIIMPYLWHYYWNLWHFYMKKTFVLTPSGSRWNDMNEIAILLLSYDYCYTTSILLQYYYYIITVNIHSLTHSK